MVQLADAAAPRDVLMAILPDTSSINAALNLAVLVRSLGHRVRFLGAHSAQRRAHVERHGFPYLAIGPEDGEAAVTRLLNTRNPLDVRRQWRVLNDRLAADADAMARNLGADLAFLDLVSVNHLPYVRMLVDAKVPTIAIVPNYASRFSTSYPPVFSSLRPDADGHWDGRPRTFAAWAKVWAMGLVPFVSPAVLIAPEVRRQLVADRRRAEQAGWRYCFGEWGARPALPEVVLAPAAADWREAGRPDRFYLGQVRVEDVLTDQEDTPLPPDDGRPLVYANVSTYFAGQFGVALGAMARRLRRLLDALLEAFAAHPEWRLVLSCGQFYDELVGRRLGENVSLHRRVRSQLAVLRRARAAIIQGGAGSVRECVHLGVPMVVYPLWTDHFGTAARVAHHQLGVAGDVEEVTAARLGELVQHTHYDPAIATAVARARTHDDDEIREREGFRAFVRQHSGVSL
jgi:hypothetical protein